MFAKPMADRKAPISGMEGMLRSMGFGPVIEMAKKLAENGTAERIMKFADAADEMNERLARIESALGLEPHTRSADGGLAVTSANGDGGISETPGTD